MATKQENLKPEITIVKSDSTIDVDDHETEAKKPIEDLDSEPESAKTEDKDNKTACHALRYFVLFLAGYGFLTMVIVVNNTYSTGGKCA